MAKLDLTRSFGYWRPIIVAIAVLFALNPSVLFAGGIFIHAAQVNGMPFFDASRAHVRTLGARARARVRIRPLDAATLTFACDMAAPFVVRLGCCAIQLG